MKEMRWHPDKTNLVSLHYPSWIIPSCAKSKIFRYLADKNFESNSIKLLTWNIRDLNTQCSIPVRKYFFPWSYTSSLQLSDRECPFFEKFTFVHHIAYLEVGFPVVQTRMSKLFWFGCYRPGETRMSSAPSKKETVSSRKWTSAIVSLFPPKSKIVIIPPSV